MQLFNYQQGHQPLVISMPHAGAYIPEPIAEVMTAEGRASIDTDWYVDRLYDFAKERGIYWLQANYSRYVIDLNRSITDETLYPGRNTTELCPTSTFSEKPIYQSGSEPDSEEIASRIAMYWQPYHLQLSSILTEIKQKFGYAILLEGHSIASKVPRFFEGQLTDFNFGTNSGRSCHPDLINAIRKLEYGNYTVQFDGVFKGGYITRHYAQPEQNIQTLQLELSQAVYMDEASRLWSAEKASHCQPILQELVNTLVGYQE